MEDLFDFLFKNWWLLIILLPWVASLIGDVFTKAARKAAEERRAGRREGRREGTAGGLGSDLPQPSNRPSAEEVAAEIRQMMGMEVVEERRSPSGSRPVILEEEWQQAPESQEAESQEAEWQEAEWQEVPAEPVPPAPPEYQPQKFGGLRQRMAQMQPHQVSTIAGRHIQPATEGGGLHDRHLQTALMQKLRARGSRYLRVRAGPALPGVHAIRAAELVDLSDPARAFVMLEVLGPPKALRDESF